MAYHLYHIWAEWLKKKIYTAQCCYNTVHFLPNPHKRHPIARPSERAMGCVLWVLKGWFMSCCCHWIFQFRWQSCFILSANSLVSTRWQGITCSLMYVCIIRHEWVNTLKPRQNGRHFADAILIFKCIFFKENVWIPIKISLKFVPKGPINYIPALVQIVAWHRPGDKPLSELMVNLLMHICVTWPEWVKKENNNQKTLYKKFAYFAFYLNWKNKIMNSACFCYWTEI